MPGGEPTGQAATPPVTDAARPSRWDPVRLAVGTLTAVPVPAPRAVTRRTAGTAMLLGPLVGLLLGAAAALPAAAATALGLGPLAAAALAVATLALGDRALHLDGLADTADGLAASYDRDRALAVMRLGNVGPAGVVTLVLVLLLQVAALADAGAASGWAPVAALALGAAAGRCALPLACLRGVPAARVSGLGATVAGTVTPLRAATALVLTAAAGAALAGGLDRPWWQGVLAVAAAGAAAGAVVARSTRRLGGVTGDVLGACVELSTAAALLVLAAG